MDLIPKYLTNLSLAEPIVAPPPEPKSTSPWVEEKDPSTGVSVFRPKATDPKPTTERDPETGVQVVRPPDLELEGIKKNLANLGYVPSREEFLKYKAAQDREAASRGYVEAATSALGAAGSGAADAVSAVGGALKEAGKEVWNEGLGGVKKIPSTLWEGGARSLMYLGAPMRASANRLGELVTAPISDQATQDELAYQNFLDKRKNQQAMAEAAAPGGRLAVKGQSGLGAIPETFEKLGEPMPAVAEAIGLTVDPVLVTGAAGALAKTGLRKALANAAQGSLRESLGNKLFGKAAGAAEGAGQAVQKAAQAPKDMAKEILGGSEDLSRPQAALKGAILGAAAEQAGAPLAKAATGLKAIELIGAGVQSAGEFLKRIAKADPNLNVSRLAQVAADETAPVWARSAAKTLEKTGMGAVGGALAAGAKAGAVGAGMGVGIGGLGAETPEELGSMAGAGAGMGVAGHALGSVLGAPLARRLRDSYTVARWYADKAPAEAALIKSKNLSRDQALKLAGLEVMMNSLSQDAAAGLQFRYVDAPTYQNLTRGSTTRAHYDPPSRTVILNADKVFDPKTRAAGRTPFHETFHDLASTGIVDMSALSTRLLGIQDAAGNVVTPGYLTPEEFKGLSDQYIHRVGDPWKTALQQERINDPAAFRARMVNEVGAEMFANMIEGAPSDFLSGVNSVTRRLADALMLREKPGILSRLGQSLHAVLPGWESRASDTMTVMRDMPDGSLLFDPLTNSPQLDALMRSIIREKRGTTSPLETKPVDAGVRFRPQEAWTQSGQKLVDLFPDNDNWRRDRQGNIIYAGGRVALRTESEIRALQADRAAQMVRAIAAVKGSGDPLEMHDMGNGHWVGRYFSDDQMRAIQAISPDILTDSMKAKIQQINDTLRTSDGTPMIFWYNAAMKNKRYSSSIGEVVRTGVPFELHISKAGNFYVNTLDIGHFERKLANWYGKRRAYFTDFQSPSDFRAKAVQYLRNQFEGRHGVEGLDPDPIKAKRMADRINDFVNFRDISTEGLVANRLSTHKDMDVLIRSRRLDRTNRLEVGAGDKVPFDYNLAKHHYSPEEQAKMAQKQPVLPPVDAKFEVPSEAEPIPGAVKDPYRLPKSPTAETLFSPDMEVQLVPKPGSKELPNTMKGPVKLVHYTNANVSKLSPKFFGKGSATATDRRGEPKIYTFVAGSDLGQDAAILGQKTIYGAVVDGSRIYDLDKGDPLNWAREINRAMADDNVKRKGYAGIHAKTNDGREVVMLFKDIKVTPLDAKTKKDRAPMFSPDNSPVDIPSIAKQADTDIRDPQGKVNPQSGFSISVFGKGPKTGYMVSEKAATERRIPIETFNQGDVEKFIADHIDELREPDKYVGGWVDPDRDNSGRLMVYLDVSTNQQDRGRAFSNARKANQKAIFDLQTGNSLYLKDFGHEADAFDAQVPMASPDGQNMSPLEKSDAKYYASHRMTQGKAPNIEDPIANILEVGGAALETKEGWTPRQVRDIERLKMKTAGKIRTYPGSPRGRTAEVLDKFYSNVKDNLRWLWNQVPEATRVRSEKWYDGARRITEKWSEETGLPRHVIAGVIASQSPQKDWHGNVALAKRIIEGFQKDVALDDLSRTWIQAYLDEPRKTPLPQETVDLLTALKQNPKKASEMGDLDAGWAIRAWSESRHPKEHALISPEGDEVGIYRDPENTSGDAKEIQWQSGAALAKAMKMLRDQSYENISRSLGDSHKVRNFYDNILFPNDEVHGAVTIDTHACAAALLRGLGSKSPEVNDLFGSPSEGRTGTQGIYWLYADAYREVAKEMGVLPRQLQSVTWEAVKGLFKPSFKRGNGKKVVDQLWKDYSSGKIKDINEVRSKILEVAGGIEKPSWE